MSGGSISNLNWDEQLSFMTTSRTAQTVSQRSVLKHTDDAGIVGALELELELGSTR